MCSHILFHELMFEKDNNVYHGIIDKDNKKIERYSITKYLHFPTFCCYHREQSEKSSGKIVEVQVLVHPLSWLSHRARKSRYCHVGLNNCIVVLQIVPTVTKG